jgi:hypothetical protein
MKATSSTKNSPAKPIKVKELAPRKDPRGGLLAAKKRP